MRRYSLLILFLLILANTPACAQSEASSAADYSNRGVARYRKGDKDGAIADYTKAIELNHKYSKALALRGAAKLRQGKDAEAQQDMEAAVKLDGSLKATVEETVNEIKQSRAAEPKP